VLQCVAVCCSVLQCATVCCNVLHCVSVFCSVLHCVCSTITIQRTGLLRPSRNETYTLILRSSGGPTSSSTVTTHESPIEGEGGRGGGGRREGGGGAAHVWVQGRRVLSVMGAEDEVEARAEIEGNSEEAVDLVVEHSHVSWQGSFVLMWASAHTVSV